MRYVLFTGIGLILLPLIILSLGGLTGWRIAALSNFNLFIHWIIFGVLTGLIPFMCKHFLSITILRISFILTLSSWLMTVIIVWILYDRLTQSTMGWMQLEMNYIYFNIIYLISILISVSVVKRINSPKE